MWSYALWEVLNELEIEDNDIGVPRWLYLITDSFSYHQSCHLFTLSFSHTYNLSYFVVFLLIFFLLFFFLLSILFISIPSDSYSPFQIPSSSLHFLIRL